jgi:hypothetical protein
METVTDNLKDTPKSTMSFIKYVFNFDDDNKAEMLNLFQYSLLAVIPLILVLKAVKQYVPEEDERKGSVEITAECLTQILFVLVSFWLIHKIVTFVPTYSTVDYKEVNLLIPMIPFLFLLLTMQTKLGAKINILTERAFTFAGLNKPPPPQQKQQGGRHQPSQADYLDTSKIVPVTQNQVPIMHPQQASQPNFNQMYVDTTNPLQNANAPVQMMMEPMAANEAMGGSLFGGSSF